MNLTRKQHFFTILILGSLATISPFSIDMYLPGFPAIAKDLGTSVAQVELSLTAYLIGIAVGQLLYGPLLDRYGRKRPLYAGLIVYIVASFFCAYTSTVENLIALRFLQALGGCVGMVAAQALIRDIFPISETAVALSSLTLVIAVSPMVAPTVGGYLTASVGWPYVFVLLGIITLVITATVVFFLPKGKDADPEISLAPRVVLKSFRKVVTHQQFALYALAGGISTSASFAYIGGSSDVIINLYGFTEQQYGWIFAFLAAGLIGSSQLNQLLLKRLTSEQLIRTALLYQSVTGIILVLGTWQHWFGPAIFIGLMFIFLTGQGLVNPNATALTLAPFHRHIGSAASLNGFIRMSVGGLVTALVSVFHNGTEVPMVGVMAFCVISGLLLILSRPYWLKPSATADTDL
ncbi:MAG: multidrug effflux MFS transporter [Cyclobacteriaceae bacterium]|nr:multidrug effflux MFS transporter [Cyclobacteriaceae bacterium]